MSPLLTAGICGLAGGALAAFFGFWLFTRKLATDEMIMISKGSGPEFYKEVELLEHGFVPQGIYVRYRNHGAKPIEMASFKVCGFKDGKLWAEFEEATYAETQPGQEQEGILKLRDYHDATKVFDLTNCTVKVEFRYAYPLSTKAA